MRNTIHPILIGTLAAGLWACDPGAEYRAALPDRDTVTVAYPATGTSEAGLSSQRQAIVGEQSDLYSQTYYASRDLNAFGKLVVDVLEAITAFPPTEYDETSATWGPFSEPREPSEWRLHVQKIEDPFRYDWRLEGRQKSEKAYLSFASGTFLPTDKGEDLGEGYFKVDFETLKKLNPAEDGNGVVGYAFKKEADRVNVRVRFNGPNEQGQIVDAGYAFEELADGTGSILFAFPGDIDDGKDGRTAIEDVVIRTRWLKDGAGRADVSAINGDLGRDTALGVQCWDNRFISTHEKITVGSELLLISVGDPSTCQITDAAPVSRDALPEETDVTNPFEVQ
jgi:hypothetical protein